VVPSPARAAPCPGRLQEIHLIGPVIVWIDLHVLIPIYIQVAEGFNPGTPAPNGLARADHEIAGASHWSILHMAAHIIGGVAQSLRASRLPRNNFLLLAATDGSQRMRNLALTKVSPRPRGFMVEQDTVAGENLVAVPVVDRCPVGIHLGNCIGTLRLEGRLLVLGRLGTANISWRRLVEARLDPPLLDGFQQAITPRPVTSPVIFGHIELTRTCD